MFNYLGGSGLRGPGLVLFLFYVSRKMASGRRVVSAIRSLVNARDLQLECARASHETLFVPVLIYVSETMLWKEKDRSRIRAVQMDNLRGLLVIRRMDRIPNARIR